MNTPINIDIPKSLPNHPWHPSVVYVSDGWNGHRYWMAQTPLPIKNVTPYLDRWELPCIHYSNDGINWSSIDTNPIDDLTNDQIKCRSYHSDPHLILVDDVLYCYYRLMEDNDKWTTILRKHSKDGVHWSDREIVSKTQSMERQIISPSIVRNSNCYRMYYVDDIFSNNNRGIQYSESIDGLIFGKSKPIQIIGKTLENTIPWHIDVQYVADEYYLVTHDVNHHKVELWKSIDGKTFEYVSLILRASNRLGDFFKTWLYRSCLVPITNNGEILRVYVSGHNGRSRHIGLLESHNGGLSFELYPCRRGWKHLQFIFQMCYEEYISFYHNVIRFIKRII